MLRIRKIASRISNLIFREILLEIVLDKIFVSPSPKWMNDIEFYNQGFILRTLRKIKLSRLLNRFDLVFDKKNESSKEILVKFDKFSFDKVRKSSIKFLIIYLHSLGHIYASNRLVNIYIERLNDIPFKKLKNRDIIELNHSIIWGNNLPSTEYLFSAVKFKSLFSKLSEYLLFEANYLRGVRNTFHKLNSSIDNEYGNYLIDRKIAIVGPKISLNIQSELTDEINTYDVVIVPSYNESNFIDSKCKVNVSYYNAELHPGLTRGNFGDLSILKFVIGRGNHLTTTEYDFRFREAHLPKFPWIVGTPNMVPLILHDLMHFNPAVIKVFGIDFFAGDKPYYDGYYYNITQANKVGFAIHNLVANWRYINHLVKLNILTIDYMGEKILNLSQSDYIMRIKKNYYS